MKLHLIGLPINAHRRLKDSSGDWFDAVPPPHIFRATPASSPTPRPFTEGLLTEIEQGVSEGFTHLVIPASRDWKRVAQLLKFNCRIHILRFDEPFRDLQWPELRAALHQVIELEETWLTRIAPHDLRHALLLPPQHFYEHNEAAEYWTKCDVYSVERIDTAAALLQCVERRHRKADRSGIRSWLDERKRRYRFDPVMHARTAQERKGTASYRFCFPLPPGFHYDVVHDAGVPFEIEIDGRRESVLHVNISPFGHVRRG